VRRIVALLWIALAVIVGAAGCASAHEVRPAYLELTERADGTIDILWKQPSRGQLAVALRPYISGGAIARRPDQVEASENFEIARWRSVKLPGRGIDGATVGVAGLDRTITDALLLIRLRDGDQISQVLTPGTPCVVVNAHKGAAVPAYLALGVQHILTGIDHLLFVFGLMLLSANLRQLLKTISAFTVAHSITLALTALRIVSINPQIIEAMVAFSILFLAVELMRKYRGETGVTIRYPWLIAFGFGLLHGAAFAGALKEIGLPEGNIPLSLFLFNVGVEIGQLIFVAAAGVLLLALRRLPMPASTPARATVAVSYAIGSFSTFWFLERLETALGSIWST